MDLYRRWIRKEHSIWKVIKEVNLDIKKQRGFVKYIVAGAAALVTALVLLLLFLPSGPINNVLGTPEKISGVVLEANQAPFRVTIDGTLTLTSEGEGDQKTIALPPL